MKKTIIPLIFSVLLAVVPAFSAEGPNIPIGDSPTRGPANAPVTIIEFIDFQ